MGQCKFCKKSAWLFRKKHKACEIKYISNSNKIKELLEFSLKWDTDFSWLKNTIDTLAKEWFINKDTLDDIYTSIYDDAVQRFLYDGILTEKEEENLSLFEENFWLNQDILNKNWSFWNFMKAIIIRDLAQWKMPLVTFNVIGKLPLKFEEDEKIVWLFEDVELFESPKKLEEREIFPTSAKEGENGPYFRTLLFKENTIDPKKITFIDQGMFVITNKNIYFDAESLRTKISLAEIKNLFSYEDGIGIEIEDATVLPQIFKGIDWWFSYNVISNLKK